MPRQDRFKKAKKSILRKPTERSRRYLATIMTQLKSEEREALERQHRAEREELREQQLYEVELFNWGEHKIDEAKEIQFNQWMLQRRELGVKNQQELDRVMPGQLIYTRFYEPPWELLDMIHGY